MSVPQVLQYIEIDLVDTCANTYGSSPCTASIPTTGARKCFNCKADCQDPDNFVSEPVTLRFGEPSTYRPLDIECIPLIEAVEFSPAVIDPGKSIGTRASITVRFRDAPHSDVGPGFDKYVGERPYDPLRQGTFWGRFRNRQKYLKGELLRWRFGFVGQDLAEFETRTFEIESFTGPSPDGMFSITAKDPLYVPKDRAMAPLANTGRLVGTMTSGTTSITIDPVGIGDAEYPASGYANIGGKEIVAFTRSGDALTLTRAQYNTDAVEHQDEELVQVCLRYSAMDPAAIIEDLLVTYGGKDPAYIDLSAWQEECANYFGRNFDGLIAEPTSVNALVDEIIEQAGLIQYWDDLEESIELQVVRQIGTDAVLYDDTVIVAGTLRVEEQPDSRRSQCHVYYGQTNPLRPLEEASNFRTRNISIDAWNEANYGQPAAMEIWSRWIVVGGRDTAVRVGDLQIGRYTDPPRKFAWSLWRGSVAMPQLGAGCRLSAQSLQDASGARELVPVQIVSVKPTVTGWDVRGIEMRYAQQPSDDLSIHNITIDYDLNGIVLKSLHDSIYATLNVGDTVNLFVTNTVVVGSTSTSLPALDVSSTWGTASATGNRTSGNATLSSLSVDPIAAGWKAGMFVRGTGVPNGAKIVSMTSNSITLDQTATSGSGTSTALTIYTVIINVFARGRIQGPGGAGGMGASGAGFDDVGHPGENGGVAIYARYPFNLVLDQGDARVWSGGGGGGGGCCNNAEDHRGGGGGGGGGRVVGAAGPAQPGSSGEGGAPGTLDAGGIGGRAYSSQDWWVAPALHNGTRGGNGGAPGENGLWGTVGMNNQVVPRGAPGVAGAAIDGVSWAKKTGTGDIRGPQIN
jgi:hypothetical protein